MVESMRPTLVDDEAIPFCSWLHGYIMRLLVDWSVESEGATGLGTTRSPGCWRHVWVKMMKSWGGTCGPLPGTDPNLQRASCKKPRGTRGTKHSRGHGFHSCIAGSPCKPKEWNPPFLKLLAFPLARCASLTLREKGPEIGFRRRNIGLIYSSRGAEMTRQRMIGWHPCTSRKRDTAIARQTSMRTLGSYIHPPHTTTDLIQRYCHIDMRLNGQFSVPLFYCLLRCLCLCDFNYVCSPNDWGVLIYWEDKLCW